MPTRSEDKYHLKAFDIGRQIGSGAFGNVFLGTHSVTGGQVAIKLEPLNAAHPQLPHEARLYKSLSGEGVCKMYWHGATDDGHYALILDLLGPSMEDLFHRCHSTFSLSTVSQLGATLMDRFEFIHSRGIVHRDVKPQNLAVRLPRGACAGGSQENRGEIGEAASFGAITVIDFGLARAFYTTEGHIALRKHQGRAGTARYASMNTHRGLTQSRRDDLESIGYLLIFLHRGRLPWQGIKAASRKEKHLKICEAKSRTPLPELCAAMPGMLEYLTYVRKLSFDAEPNYLYLRGLFERGEAAPADWTRLPPSAFAWQERPQHNEVTDERTHSPQGPAAAAGARVAEGRAEEGEGRRRAEKRPAATALSPLPLPRTAERQPSPRSGRRSNALELDEGMPMAKRKRGGLAFANEQQLA